MITARAINEVKKASCTLMVMTRNGEATIARALDSALGCKCFDHILIMLDTMSRDKTSALLTEYQLLFPQVIHIIGHNWKRPPDFSEARNRMIGYALKHLRTDYAAWLDDDEVISDCDAFNTLLARRDGSSYLIWVISPLPHGGSHDMYQPRLFPLVPGVIFECPVFERLDFSLRRTGTPIQETSFRAIHHDGYQDNNRLKAKNNRNRQIIRHFLNSKKGKFANIYQQFEHMRAQHESLNNRRGV